MHNRIIEIGIIALLIYTPLAFGGVTPGALAVLEILSAGLLLLWLVQQLFTHKDRPPSVESEPGHSAFFLRTFVKKIFTGASFLFLGIIYVQTFALPASFTKILSPKTYALYSEAAFNTGSSLPSRLPLSVYAYTTENEWAKLVAYAIVFFLMTRVIRSRTQINRLLHIIFIMGCLEAVYSFLQFFSGAKLLDLYPARGSFVSGSFVNKNHFAGYLEMVIPLCFALLLTQFRRNGSTRAKLAPEHFRETYPKVFLLLLALFFMVAALLLSGSRGGIVSFSCATMFFVLLARQRRLLRRKVVLVLIFIALSIALTIFLNPDILTQRIYTFNSLESDSSFQVRRELWRSALHIFQDYPINGSGLGSFTHLNPRYRTFRDHLRHYEYAENDYVQLLAESGIIGTVLLLLAGFTLGVQLFTLWRQRHSRWKIALVAGGMSGMFSLLIHSGTDFNLRIPSNALLFVTIAALCVNIVTLPSSRRNTSEESPLPLDKMRASGQRRTASPFLRNAVLLPILILTALFLFHAGKRYLAERQYQYAVSQNSTEAMASSDPQDVHMQNSRDSFERALHSVSNNADYFHGMGTLLFGMARSNTLSTQDAAALLHESESRMKQAIMLNPSNPWFYYELGRMKHDTDTHASAVYFQAALKNAPKEIFLRKAIGQWFLFYDRDEGRRIMRELAAGDSLLSVEGPEISLEFARLLYDFQLDYDAERELSRRNLADGHASEAGCRAKLLSNPDDSIGLEFGNDTGIAEWKAPLKRDTERIHKSICLPEDLRAYQYCALRIYMNNGGRKDFTAHISINEHRVKSFTHEIPQRAGWYEIPFDIHLLQGLSKINMYLRVENASEAGNFLQIWGESHTPNSRSTWNFDSTEDLSSEEGRQQGEYLIRLVLRK